MGGSSQKAPQAYQPAGQPQADANYQQLVNNALPWASGLPGQVIPGLNTAATNIGNNPYNAGALAGAQGVSNLATGSVAPNMLNANSNLYGLGDIASAYAPTASYGTQYADPTMAAANASGQAGLGYGQLGANYGLLGSGYGQLGANYGQGAVDTGAAGYGIGQNAIGAGNAGYNMGQGATQVGLNGVGIGNYGLNTGNSALNGGSQALQAGGDAFGQGGDVMSRSLGYLPQATAGMSVAPSILMSGQAKADKLWGETQRAIPGLTTGGNAAASQLLANGFDPQGALYNRNFQQQQDQQNAINAMYGLGNSAYGAGVAGQKANDFNLDWQNQQLGRQISALGAYDTHTGQATSNLTNLLNTGANGWSGLSGTAVNNFNNLNNSGVNNANSLMNTGMNAYLGGTGALQTGANTYNNSANTALSGAGVGLQGVNTALSGYGLGLQGANTALSGYGLGLQGANTALSGYGLGLQGANTGIAGANAGMQGAGLGLQGVNTNLNALTTGANAFNSLMGGGIDRFNALLNGAGAAYGQGAGQGVDALNTLNTATNLPSNTYNQQQMAYIQALQALASGGAQSLSPTTSLAASDGNYMSIGQNATALNQNAASINNAAQAAQMNALMSGLGTIAGIAMAPTTGGASLFGLASGGGGGNVNFLTGGRS